MPFELPDLPYSYGSLEPHFDAKTMEIHHTKHHAGYTAKLNAALDNTDLKGQSIEEILKNLNLDNKPLRNNAGGYYNHNLFWQILRPPTGSENAPSGDLLNEINKKFGSFDSFKNAFSNTAATVFGSGWAWLCTSNKGELCICSSPNQDNPLMPGVGCNCTPILGLDVWEHAYYLNYQNRRPDYISAFFNLINWDTVAKRRESLLED